MQPEEKQQMMQIKQLIQSGQYLEARARLGSLTHLEIARKWSSQLDVRLQGSQASGTQQSGYVGRHPGFDLQPVHPSTVWSIIYNSRKNLASKIGLFFWRWIPYSFNWVSYGKPSWRIPSLVLGTSIFALSVISMFYAISGLASYAEWAGLSLGIGLALGLSFFTIALGFLQREAYSAWRRDATLLPNYKYPFIMAVMGWFLATAAVIGLLGFGFYQYLGPVSVDHDLISLQHPRGWSTEDTESFSFCVDSEYGCFLRLEKPDVATMLFVHIPANGTEVEQLANILWVDYESYLDYRLVSQTRWDINGHDAIVREYEEFDDNQLLVYSLDVQLLGEMSIINVIVWANDKVTFDANRDQIENIIRSIELKS